MTSTLSPTLAVGRFAPSPTGPLHLGSLVTAVGSYLFARSRGGRWLLRIEDIDTQRVVKGCDGDILRTLEALGLCWDGEIVYQSKRTERYEAALFSLLEKGLAYPCGCTRSEIASAPSAPHPGEEGPPYPGFCRRGIRESKIPRSTRVCTGDGEISFTDLLRGKIAYDLSRVSGDFVLKRGDGIFAYQLAVVVDDHDAGVTQVVRGADLLSSTPRQILLQKYLGFPVPSYAHLPLVLGPEGQKLSKRESAVSLLDGVNPRKKGSGLIASALAFLGHPPPPGLDSAPPEEMLAFAVENFDPARIPLADSPLNLKNILTACAP
ncbi:tRNA glutamyl-Q(34) synthetase GluQRS [bacterium]|nr:MAG: tRNA glutamyl-Q(34) synthetase GluQRS [bacterium]